MVVRIVLCVFLIFIIPFPYNLLLAFIPFVFPYKYQCDVCGLQHEKDELVNIDWREKEEMYQTHQWLEEQLTPHLNMWIEDDNENVYKVVKGNGQFLLIGWAEERLEVYRIYNIASDTEPVTLHATSNVSHSFRVNDYSPNPERTEFGERVLTTEEFNVFKEGDQRMKQWLQENEQLAGQLKIEFEKEE